MADAEGPFTFRHDPAGGGALADLGSHALATAEYLLGPIEQVMGDAITVINSRPDGRGGRRAVEVDDVGRAFLRFANGATGSIEASWIATGRRMQHDFEVYGSRGALVFLPGTLQRAAFLQRSRRERPSQASGVSRLGPSMNHMGSSASRRAINWGSMTLRQLRLHAMSKRLAARTEPFDFRAGVRIQELVAAITRSTQLGVGSNSEFNRNLRQRRSTTSRV